MEELFEILKEFDINNIGVLIVISIILISVMTGYIHLFHASRIETVLMSKNEQSKRFSFIYFILFFVFGVINYLFVINVFSVIVNSVLLMITGTFSRLTSLAACTAASVFTVFRSRELSVVYI